MKKRDTPYRILVEIVCICICLFFGLCFAGCTTIDGGGGGLIPRNKQSRYEVPDERIRIELEDNMEAAYPNCNEYSFYSVHTPDKKLHTDSVNLFVTVDYDFGAYTFSTQMTFQYNKSSDLWERISGGKWENTRIEWKENLFMRVWEGVIPDWSYDGATYTVNVRSTNLAERYMEAWVDFEYHTMGFVNSFTPEEVLESIPYYGELDFEEQMDGEMVWRYIPSRIYSIWLTPKDGITITDWGYPEPLR
ncbi:MAG: hypothetical protein IKQ69_01340 [Oscillospiraceae bacterium]|nr:hypothetical protein [Oscillospiraceae bacterium]